MNKFGIPDSVINSVAAVLEAGNKMPRQLKDPKKETMMGFQYKPGKVRNQVVDKKDVKDKEKKGYIHTENIAIESLEIAKLIEDYQLNEYFDREHVGSSKNYHIHSTNPEEGSYELTHKKTGKKTSINVSDNYPMNRTKHVKKNIAGKVPGSDHHGIAKKINSHLQGDTGTGDVRKSLRKDGHKRSDAMEAFEDDIAEAMEMHLKPHGTAGTHYTVHKVGKKLAAHGGIKVGDKLSDTHVDDARDSGVKVRHVKEEVEVDEGKIAGSVRYVRGWKAKGVSKEDAHKRAKEMDIHPKVVDDHYKDQHEEVEIDEHKGDKPHKHPHPPVDETEVKESGMGRVATDVRLGNKPGTGLKGFKKKSLDSVDHKDLKGSHADRKDKDIDNDGDVDDSDTYLHHRRKTVKKAMKEDAGEEKVRSSAQAAQLAKHYYAKAKQAQASGSPEEAAKMMSAAKSFYRKSEGEQAQEKGGKQVAAAESTEDTGPGEFYFNELEIEEIEAAEDIVAEAFKRGETGHDVYIPGGRAHKGEHKFSSDQAKANSRGGVKVKTSAAKIKSGKYAGNRKNSGAKVGETERSGHRVTKTEKEGPEHIVMQARKVVSLGQNHSGVEFKDGSKSKVDPKHAHAALNRYNQAKPTEKEHMQNTMDHSHAGFKHVASGKPMDHPDNPHKPKSTNKLSGKDRRTDRAMSMMKHPDDEE